jgi:DNA-binding NarL/FixJ family response regulator
MHPKSIAIATAGRIVPARDENDTSTRTLSQIRLLVVDGEPVGAQGLSAVLATQPDFRVVGVATNGSDGLRLVEQLRPDVTLLDLSVPGLAGVDVMRWLRGCRVERTGAVIMFVSVLDHYNIVDLLRLGVRGIVRKDCPTELVFKSIRRVHAGEMWINRKAVAMIARAFLARDKDDCDPRTNYFGLTHRELTVLQLIVRGDTNGAIARALGVSENTIKHHVTSIFGKTGVSSRLELALFALHHHLVAA